MKTHCRWCGGRLTSVLSLRNLPLVNYFPTKKEIPQEKKYPLDFCVCRSCGLAQLGQTVAPQKLFVRYHYLTGTSEPLVRSLTTLAQTSVSRHHLPKGAKVLDIGSNDGTLLLSFQKLGLRVLGVEPASAIARTARGRGIPTINGFFTALLGRTIRKRYGQFDLVTATHVLANIADLRDFLAGVAEVLSPDGIFTVEVGSLENLVRHYQFDSIYHEHFSYFSLPMLQRIFESAGFSIVSARKEGNQGGSLRIEAVKRVEGREHRVQLKREKEITREDYKKFAKGVVDFRNKMKRLFQTDLNGKTVVGFGAPAKGVTLLNYCGLGPNDITFLVDSTPAKQGRFMPGVHIPVYPEAYLKGKSVDAILVLAWNYRDEVMRKIKQLVRSPVTVIIPFPTLTVTILQ